MAILKLGSVITEASGSLGGSVIQKGTSAHILRNKPTPCRPTTAKQFSIRSKIKTIQRAWISLLDDQRKEWNAFPAWANQHIKKDSQVLLNGHDLYLKYQLYRLIMDYSLLTTIQYVPLIDLPYIFVTRTRPDLTYIWFIPSIDTSKLNLILKISKPAHKPQPFRSNSFHFMKGYWWSINAFVINDPIVETFGICLTDYFYSHLSILWFSAISPVFSTTTILLRYFD